MKTTGWVVALSALGMMCSLVAKDMAGFHSWSDLTSFLFVSNLLEHLSVVIAAFVGGNLIPNMFSKNGDGK